MKNKKNKVGAPSKPVNWPKTPFTVKELIDLNSKGDNKQCALSLRQKVGKLLNSRKLVVLQPVKQPENHVGRPNFSYVLRENFNPEKHVKAGKAKTSKVKTVKATKVKKTNVGVIEVTPTVAPVSAPIVVTAPPVATPVASAPAAVENLVTISAEATAPAVATV